MKSLILFGDSHLGRFSRRWMKMVEENVKDTVVYNCAAGGQYTSDGVKQAPLISKLKPDYVVISFGGNDSSRPKQITPKMFEENMISIIDSFKGSKIILLPCPPGFDEDPKELERWNKQITPYNEVLKKVAKNKKVNIIDSEEIYRPLLERGENYHEEGGIHMNDLGYETLTKEIIGKIK